MSIKDEPSPDNTLEENQEIYNGGMVVKDDRKHTTKIIPKVISKNNVFGPPTENGIYEILNSDGQWDTMIVFMKLMGLDI